jgi:hypothetical protein
MLMTDTRVGRTTVRFSPLVPGLFNRERCGFYHSFTYIINRDIQALKLVINSLSLAQALATLACGSVARSISDKTSH